MTGEKEGMVGGKSDERRVTINLKKRKGGNLPRLLRDSVSSCPLLGPLMDVWDTTGETRGLRYEVDLRQAPGTWGFQLNLKQVTFPCVAADTRSTEVLTQPVTLIEGEGGGGEGADDLCKVVEGD